MSRWFSKLFSITKRSSKTTNETFPKATRSYDKYIVGLGIGSLFYMVIYSIYDNKAIRIFQHPPIPKYNLVKDDESIRILRKKFFFDLDGWFSFLYHQKMSVSVVGNLGSGKSILMYHLCSELYKLPSFYDIRLPSSKICVFFDMTNCDTFLESLRFFIVQLNKKSHKDNINPYHPDILEKMPYDQASYLLSHMFSILKDHPGWCIVLDNITRVSFNEMKDIFLTYFSLNNSGDYSLSDMGGKIVYVCDENIPLIDNVFFFQYNELSKKTAQTIVKNSLELTNIKESDISCLVDLLSGSPLALISACYLVKAQLYNKRHITLKEATNTIATTISFLTDKVAKKQNFNINADNFSYFVTMTTFTMLYKTYHIDTIIPYQFSILSDMNQQTKLLMEKSFLALNCTFELLLDFFNPFQIGTKIPDTIISHFINRYISPLDSQDISKLLSCTILTNPVSNNEQSVFRKYYNEYVIMKRELQDFILGSNKKSFIQPNEKLNDLIEWLPFIRFQKYSEQNLVSLHPLVHESSKIMLKIFNESNNKLFDKKNILGSSIQNRKINTDKIQNQSIIRRISSYISPKSISRLKSEDFNLKNNSHILLDIYQKLKHSFFNTEGILKLHIDKVTVETRLLDFISNLIDSITFSAPIRYGDSVYFMLKQISLIQRIVYVFLKNCDAQSNDLFTSKRYQCIKKTIELLLNLNQPKFVVDILENNQFIVNYSPYISSKSKTMSYDLLLLSIYLCEAYIKLNRLDDAKLLLDKLWLDVDPNHNIQSNPYICIRLIYTCCMLYDRLLECDNYKGNIEFAEEIFSYLMVVYNYQFQNTLLSTPIFDENEAAFFIDIMLLFSSLCLKYNKLGYALKFTKDANIMNENVLKSGLSAISSQYDVPIKDMFIKCYEFQGNTQMVQKMNNTQSTF